MIQRLFLTTARFALALVALSGALSATGAPGPIPAGGTTVITPGDLTIFQANIPTDIDAHLIPVTGQPFKQALSLTTRKQPENAWAFQLVATSIAPITKGDTLFAQFWLRCKKAAGAGYGLTELIVENATTYDKSVAFGASANSAWKHYQVPFTSLENLPAGSAHINFHLGFPPQSLELADVTLVDYGTAVKVSDLPRTTMEYDGISPNAPWRKAAEARIDRYRKGNLIVHVVDRTGKPVHGASVQIKMTRQAFGFGTAVDMRFMEDTPDAKRYRAMTYSLFNKVVVGNALKWGPWEQTQGQYGRANAIRQVDELRAHGMDVRGHNLVWPSQRNLPEDVWALHTDPAALSARIDNHIKEEMTALSGKCTEWDVVNEPYDNHDVQDILGPTIMARWYREAHAIDPAARLFINDYSITESGGTDIGHINNYDHNISALLARHAPLQGIGLQSHFGDILTSPDKVYEILNRFARFGLPLEVTEFDVNTEDEKLQAAYWRDYLTITYSHPAITSFMMWGFWEGDHWIPRAAPWRKDWTERPSAKVLTNLLRHEWWTNTSGVSNTSGIVTSRVFLGNYDIVVTRGGHSTTIHAQVHKNQRSLTSVNVTID